MLSTGFRRAVLWFALAASAPAVALYQSWTSIGPPGGWVEALVVDPFAPATALAGTQGSTPVLRSTDRGGSWLPASTGFPGFAPVLALAADTLNPGTFYAGTRAGLYKSTDGATSWTASDPDELGLYSIVSVELPSHLPGTVYAAEPNTVFKSSDGGLTFDPLPPLPRVPEEPVPPAPTPGQTFKSLVQEVKHCRWCALLDGKTFADGELLVVATDGGLFVTDDDGALWRPAAESLPTREITRFAEAMPEPGDLYLGSAGSGVFGFVGGGPWRARGRFGP